MSLIYLVEDDENIREMMRYALTASGFDVDAFEQSEPFWRALNAKLPALILLDIFLPGEDGLSILRSLRARAGARKLPVIMVSAKGAEMDKVTGLDLGADDYLSKPFSILELISRVKAVLRRSAGEEEELLRASGIVLDVKRRTASVPHGEIALTFKEFELLSYLMLNQGIVLSRDQIMDRVWGTEYGGESRTVDMHIKTLRQKLGESGKAIGTVRNVGYKVE
ncbi:MAG: response regulator transcription factor [Clostridia bacterium]|nr:response regulator transcription factor [Clostridia bacterium]